MIPIRARTDAPITCLGGVRDLSPNHPLADLLCPVCDESVDLRPITLVLVGFRPADRAKGKTFVAGGGVIVHADCAGAQTPATVCDCGCQPGQPCGCGLDDCECVGDCPVCDASDAEHVDQEADRG